VEGQGGIRNKTGLKDSENQVEKKKKAEEVTKRHPNVPPTYDDEM